jgi:hypothetical protein
MDGHSWGEAFTASSTAVKVIQTAVWWERDIIKAPYPQAIKAGSDLVITWQSPDGDKGALSKQVDLYRIYRDTVAQFEPSAVPFDSTTDTFYVDISGVVGDTDHHYYYAVTAVSDGEESVFSGSVGEFDKGLANGE